MEPTGEVIKVSVNGQEKIYHIKPNVFSDYTIQRLAALVKSKRREERGLLIRDFAQAGLNKEQMEAAMHGIMEDSKQTSMIGWAEAVDSMQSMDTDALCIVLTDCCDEIKTEAEARQVISSYRNISELVNIIFASGQEAVDLAEKN